MNQKNNLNEAAPVIPILSKAIATALRSPIGKAIAKELLSLVIKMFGEKMLSLVSEKSAPKIEKMLEDTMKDNKFISEATEAVVELLANNADKIIKEGLRRDTDKALLEGSELNERQKSIIREALSK
jgi:predicted subunit of tRNA(5-methylaminomethyl-2-thiouridylate) methyltransferase